MPELPLSIPIYIPFVFHCLIGGIATAIAFKKGYSIASWLVIGLIGGTVALVLALRLHQKVE